VDAASTSAFRSFMATNADQKAITWPKVNLNPGWSGHNWISSQGDPVWKLSGGPTEQRLDVLRNQGVHMADAVWTTVPTGTQDRLLVVRDGLLGYTMQCADVAVSSQTARTFTASSCGVFWHSSNGLDYRNPLSRRRPQLHQSRAHPRRHAGPALRARPGCRRRHRGGPRPAPVLRRHRRHRQPVLRVADGRLRAAADRLGQGGHAAAHQPVRGPRGARTDRGGAGPGSHPPAERDLPGRQLRVVHADQGRPARGLRGHRSRRWPCLLESPEDGHHRDRELLRRHHR
jgi:hypothetical protein